MTPHDLKILRECAGLETPSPWGGAVGASLEFLRSSGYLHDGSTVTDKGRHAIRTAELAAALPPGWEPMEGGGARRFAGCDVLGAVCVDDRAELRNVGIRGKASEAPIPLAVVRYVLSKHNKRNEPTS